MPVRKFMKYCEDNQGSGNSADDYKHDWWVERSLEDYGVFGISVQGQAWAEVDGKLDIIVATPEECVKLNFVEIKVMKSLHRLSSRFGRVRKQLEKHSVDYMETHGFGHARLVALIVGSEHIERYSAHLVNDEEGPQLVKRRKSVIGPPAYWNRAHFELPGDYLGFLEEAGVGGDC